MHQDAPVLPLLDHHEARPKLQQVLARAHRVAMTRELLRLVKVEHQPIDLAQELGQLWLGDIDPQVHRVRDTQSRVRDLIEHPHLHHRVRVREEHDLRILERLRNHRRRLFQHPQIGKQGIAMIHVFVVLAAPTEGLGPTADLKPRQIQPFERLERVHKRARKIVADGGHHPRVRIKGSSRGEVDRGPAQKILVTTATGCFHRVDPDRACDN